MHDFIKYSTITLQSQECLQRGCKIFTRKSVCSLTSLRRTSMLSGSILITVDHWESKASILQ